MSSALPLQMTLADSLAWLVTYLLLRCEGEWGAWHFAPLLYRLLCAVQGESFLTATESNKHNEVLER